MGNQTNTDTIFCFNAETGRKIWTFSYPAPLDPVMYEGGPNATPTVEGNRVYTMGKKSEVYCLDAEKGTVLWSNNIAEKTGAVSPQWGFASSPLIQDNLVVFAIGDHGAALERTTGQIVWSSGTNLCGFSTPVPCVFAGTPSVAIFSAAAAYGVETKTGKVFWSYPWKNAYNLNVADVIVSGDEFFISTVLDQSSQFASVARVKGAVVAPVWQNDKMRNHINSCVLLDGYLYGVDGGVNTTGEATLKCLEFATGVERWNYKGLGGGGIILADHKVIMLSDIGELVVGEASPAGFNPISRAQVLGGKCWTVPTLASGRIYCRNAKGDLICLDVKGS
jgi:outer membrane protein assembly factor BamB